MTSEVGICNSALNKIGAKYIASLSEGSANANACNEQYAKVRDALLRSHNWNFAMKRVQLAQLSTTPAFGFDYEYQLPSDWLRVVSVHDNDEGTGAVKYKIEGKKILTDSDELYLRYVHQITDPNEMTADFHEALAYLLAKDLSTKIANSNTLRELSGRDVSAAVLRAKSTDAIEDYPEEFPESSWVTER